MNKSLFDEWKIDDGFMVFIVSKCSWSFTDMTYYCQRSVSKFVLRLSWLHHKLPTLTLTLSSIKYVYWAHWDQITNVNNRAPMESIDQWYAAIWSLWMKMFKMSFWMSYQTALFNDNYQYLILSMFLTISENSLEWDYDFLLNAMTKRMFVQYISFKKKINWQT